MTDAQVHDAIADRLPIHFPSGVATMVRLTEHPDAEHLGRPIYDRMAIEYDDAKGEAMISRDRVEALSDDDLKGLRDTLSGEREGWDAWLFDRMMEAAMTIIREGARTQ